MSEQEGSPQEEISTDQIVAELNSSSGEPAAEATGQPVAPPKPWWEEKLKDEVEYSVNGKPIKEPLDMLRKRAGMGYHYAQQMHILNSEKESFAKERERLKALEKWQQYDEYAKNNPKWAEHVEQAWNQRQNLQQLNQEPNPEIESLKRELGDLRKFKDEFVSERDKQRNAFEDKQFNDEISTVAKTYGVDLSQSDEQGKSLEWRVLEHMKALGLDGTKQGHFSAAFRDYYFDNLVSRQQAVGKEADLKSKVELNKAGIREISRTPKKPYDFKGHIPNMSWNDLSDAALEELRANSKS